MEEFLNIKNISKYSLNPILRMNHVRISSNPRNIRNGTNQSKVY